MNYLGINEAGLAVSGIWPYNPTGSLPEGQTAQEMTGEADLDWTWDGTTWLSPLGWVEPDRTIELRVAAYPSQDEQLDMQYWDALNGTSTWVDAITSIKVKYPKK